jgi:hypothetical protein
MTLERKQRRIGLRPQTRAGRFQYAPISHKNCVDASIAESLREMRFEWIAQVLSENVVKQDLGFLLFL